MKRLLVLLLVALLGAAAAQPDPCAFTNAPGYGVWVASHAEVYNCISAEVAKTADRDAIAAILNYTWNAYSFKDYVAQAIPPYNIQVRPPFKDCTAGFSSSSYPSYYLYACQNMSLLLLTRYGKTWDLLKLLRHYR